MKREEDHNKSLSIAFAQLSDEVHRALKGHLRLVSTRTLAELLDCSETWIYKARKAGIMPEPAHKIWGGRRGYRWTIQQIETFIAQNSLRTRSLPDCLQGGKGVPQ